MNAFPSKGDSCYGMVYQTMIELLRGYGISNERTGGTGWTGDVGEIVGVTGRLGIQPVRATAPALRAAAKAMDPVVARSPELDPNLSVVVGLASQDGMEPGGPEKQAINAVLPP